MPRKQLSRMANAEHGGADDFPRLQTNERGQPIEHLNEYMRRVMPMIKPTITAQAEHFLGDYRPPIYSRAVFQNRRRFQRETTAILGYTSCLRQGPLSDSEAQAVVEHHVDKLEKQDLTSCVITVMAAAMTGRGLATHRFPFWQPKPNSAWMSYLRRPGLRFLVTSARYMAYYNVISFTVSPVSTVFWATTSQAAIERDPRCADLTRDTRRTIALCHTDLLRLTIPFTSSNRPQASSESGTIAAQAQPAWLQERQAEQAQAPLRGGDWNAPQDDASPVAPSTGNIDADNDPAMMQSAWDRIRNQSSAESSSRSRASWHSPQKRHEDERRTGDRTGPASPKHRSSSSPSFVKSGQEQTANDSQAQKEFDELLERERRGTDQEKRTWSTK